MIVETNIHEVKKRENSLLIIKKIIQSNGRNQLFDHDWAFWGIFT